MFHFSSSRFFLFADQSDVGTTTTTGGAPTSPGEVLQTLHDLFVPLYGPGDQ
jgi:hypothetical protein